MSTRMNQSVMFLAQVNVRFKSLNNDEFKSGRVNRILTNANDNYKLVLDSRIDEITSTLIEINLKLMT